MERKQLLGILVALGLFVGLVVYPQVKWQVMFKLDVEDAIGDKKLGRFPSAAQVIGFRDKITELAKARGYEQVTVKESITGRSMAGGVVFYVLTAEVEADGRTTSFERRVETSFKAEDIEALQEAGIPFTRPS